MVGEINFGALQMPDFVGNALEAYQSGQKQRQALDQRNALALYGSGDRKGGINALMAVNPEAALKLEDRETDLIDRQRKEKERQTRIDATRAYANGDTKGARAGFAELGDMDAITGLDEASRKAAQKATEDLAEAALSLKGGSYEERREALANPQFQAWLGQHGFTPEKLAGFDPTDQALDRFIEDAMSFADRLKQKNDDRDFALRSKKQEWDMKHGDRTAATAEKNADSRRITATRPRAGRAGSNDPGKGFTVLPPGQ